MKALILILLAIVGVACSKKSQEEIIVTNLDQISGTWKWESTCGGIVNSCGYSSDSHYAELILSTAGQYVHMRNDTIYETATYAVIKGDDTYGTIILDNIISPNILSNHIEYSISIRNNELNIMRGELIDTYKKIR